MLIGTFIMPCGTRDCPKRIDGKCSIWNKPSKSICKDYITAFEQMAKDMARITKTLNFGTVYGMSSFRAGAVQRELINRQILDPPIIPSGTVVFANGSNHAGMTDAMVYSLGSFPGARIDRVWYNELSSKEQAVKKEITLKEALDLSILLWDDLAESGAEAKSSTPYWHKIKDMKSSCPMCQHFYVADRQFNCDNCPLEGCSPDKSLFGRWQDAEGKVARKQAAKNLSQRLKDFRAEKFPESKSISYLEAEKIMLKDNLEYSRKEIKRYEGNIHRSQTLCNTMIDRLQVVGQELKAQKEAQQKRLFLCVAGDHNFKATLYIGYGNGPDFDVIAQLNNDKCFEALSDEDMLASYNDWIKDGEHVDDESTVRYKDRTYKLSEKGKLYSTNGSKAVNDYQRIYDFKSALPACSCKDPNIITTEHNNRVVIF